MPDIPFKTQLEDGRIIVVSEPAAEGVPALEAAAPGLHVICHAHAGGPGHIQASRIALTDDGREVIAAGWVQHRPGEAHGDLHLSVHTAYQHDRVLTAFLREMAQAARGLGIEELIACVPGPAGDLRTLFRDAGLQVVSALPSGGMGEYRLRLEST